MNKRYITKRNSEKSGFTLIEVIVVAAIISLLVCVVLASTAVAGARARDTKRISDLHQIQNAIELYRTDTGLIPATGTGGSYRPINSTCAGWAGVYGFPSNVLVPKYISKIPDDPRSLGAPVAGDCSLVDSWWYYYGQGWWVTGSSYHFDGSNNRYIICTKLENPTLSFTGILGEKENFCLNGGDK